MESHEASTHGPSPFSIFRALRIEHHELRHSNFLAWLIDPQESHAQGPLFLHGLLETLVERIKDTPVANKLKVEHATAQDTEIVRERNRLDINIILRRPKVIIGIENKIYSSEHSDQLHRYADYIESHFEAWDRIYFYLTLDGEQPSDPRWRSFTHRRILSMIERRIHLLKEHTAEPVRAFIQHYVQLLREIYRLRPEKRKTDGEIQELVDKWVKEDAEIYGMVSEEIPGLNRFKAALRRIVLVPKSEVDRRVAEDKAARKSAGRSRKGNRRHL
jgi:hypothetical protein